MFSFNRSSHWPQFLTNAKKFVQEVEICKIKGALYEEKASVEILVSIYFSGITIKQRIWINASGKRITARY